MLDTQGQVNAFQILNSSGLETPATVMICRAISNEATRKADVVTALLLVDATYPQTVSKYTGKLPDFSRQLKSSGAAAAALADAISPHCTPSQLLQLKIGWECHVKGNGITPAPKFWLVAGMGDTATPQSLSDAVGKLSTGALTDAMNAINIRMNATGTTSGAKGGTAGGGVPAAPAITENEIKALKDAVEGLSVALDRITSVVSDVSKLAGNINTSIAQATRALDSAVSVTLASGLKNDAVMRPAISLIMPAGVIGALDAEKGK